MSVQDANIVLQNHYRQMQGNSGWLLQILCFSSEYVDAYDAYRYTRQTIVESSVIQLRYSELQTREPQFILH